MQWQSAILAEKTWSRRRGSVRAAFLRRPPARPGRGPGGGGARVTFVSPTGLRPLPAGGASLRLCSTRVAQEGINKPVIDRIIRVDHAGEYGANRIYAGQMAVLGRSSVGPVIQVSAPWSHPCAAVSFAFD